MSINKLAEELSNYGITGNQAKVYIATAKLGISSVSQISKNSSVPREEVYRLLPELENLGLIEKTIERPMKVKATNFRSVLSILIKHKRERAFQTISELEAKKDQILKDFLSIKLESKSKETTKLTIITERHAIIQKIMTMIRDARKGVFLSLSREQLIYILNNYSLQVKKALDRGIEFRILLEKVEYDSTINELVKDFEKSGIIKIRFVDQHQGHYILIDNKEALVSTSLEYIGLGNRPYLWTTENSLIRLMLENFEIMWLTSRHMEAIEKESDTEKLRSYFSTLQPTQHLMFIYRSLESKYNVLCNYLKVGLEKGEAVVYISSERNHRKIREMLKLLGIDVEKNEKTGALRILGFEEFYIIDGTFDISRTNVFLKKMYNNALENGLRGCRVFGDMNCFFQHDLNNELIEYEKTLHRILDIPIIGMCAYNADILDKGDSVAEEYKELVKTHGKTLFMGQDKHLEKFEIR